MKNNNSSVLLIGATGLLGAATGIRLNSEGFRVIVFLRHGREYLLRFPATEIRFGDLESVESLVEALQGVDTVLYFPAMSVPGKSPFSPKHEIISTLPCITNVLEAMTIVGCPNIIFPSSSGAVYGDTQIPAAETFPMLPGSSYALGKILSEELIRFYARLNKLTFTILRFSNIYGSSVPRTSIQGIIDRCLDDACSGQVTPVWGSLETKRDYLFVDDAAASVLFVLKEPQLSRNQIFNVGSGVSTSLREVLSIIGQVTRGCHAYKVEGGLFSGPLASQIQIGKFLQTFKKWHLSVDLRKGISTTLERKLSQINTSHSSSLGLPLSFTRENGDFEVNLHSEHE